MKSVFHIILISLFFTDYLYCQWTPTGGPEGGAGILFKDQHLFWCCTAAGGLYVSSDEGLYWTRHPDIPQNATVFKIVRKSEWLFAATDVYTPQSGYQCRIYRSSDDGITWQIAGAVSNMIQSNSYINIAVIGGNLYLFNGTSQLFRSLNNGVSWVNIPIPNAIASTLYFGGETILTNSYDQGLFVSSNGGMTWNLAADTAAYHFIDFPLIRDSTIIGKGYAAGAPHNYVISGDLGLSWDTIPTFGATILDFRFLEGGGDTLYALNNRDDKQLYMSPDNGVNWQPAGYFDNYIHPKLRTTDGGLRIDHSGTIKRYSSQNQQWTKSENGLVATGSSSIGTNSEYLFSWNSHNELSRKKLDGNGDWEKITVTNNDLSNTNMAVAGDSIYLAGYKTIYLVKNNGEGPMDTLNADSIPGSIYRMTVEGNYLVISSYDNITLIDRLTKHITRLDSLPGEDNPTRSLVMFGQRWVYTDGEGNAFVSEDQGNTWVQTLIEPGIVLDNNNFLYRMHGDMLVYVLDEHLAVSKDKGETWSFVYKGLKAEQASVIPKVQKINNLNDNTWVLTTFWEGIFISKDSGQNWISFNHGLPPNQLITATAAHQQSFVSTLGAGIWERDISLAPVNGTVFFDQNGNGTQGNTEPGMPNILVTTIKNGLVTQTDSSGHYTTYADLTDTVHVLPPSPYAQMNPEFLATAQAPPGSFNTAVTFTPGIHDLKMDLTVISTIVSGFDNALVIKCSNVGTVPLNPKVVLIVPDSIWVSSTDPQTSGIYPDSVVWNLPSLLPLQTHNLVVKFYVSPQLSINDIVSFSTIVYPLVGDEFTPNNYAEIRETVVASYDPNDKRVDPKDYFTPAQLANNENLHYTIRFQNTGNYPATFVRITDTLANTLDPATFQFISASHPVRWSFIGKNVLQFYFGNIQLPDSSTNELQSHGFVKFAVRPVAGLPEGTSLQNKAAIFFDYNAPVITNIATNVFDYESITKEKVVFPLTVFPNPASGWVQVVRNTSVSALLVVVDHSGKIIYQKQIREEKSSLDMGSFPAAVYQVYVIEQGIVREGKVVKN